MNTERSDADSYMDREAANSDSIRRAAARDSGWLRRWGWITTILFWPLGLVLAIMLLSRGDRKHGGWMLGICGAWAAVAAIAIISAAAGSDTLTAKQLQVDLPRAITENSGDTFTNVTCAHEGANVYECVGSYRMSLESAQRGAATVGLDESYVDMYRQQQSGSVTYRVIVDDDGTITWRPV